MTESKNTLLRSACWAGAIAMLFAMPGCGSGSSGGTGGTVAVAPAPAPAPSPNPTPTPSPASTLSERLGSGPLLEVLREGDVISGPLVCVEGGVFATEPDGTIRLASVTGLLQSDVDNSLNIRSRGTDHYRVDGVGSAGSRLTPTEFSPTDKRASGARLLTEFRRPEGQLQIANPLRFATLGFLANGNTGFCVFAAGPLLGARANTSLTAESGLLDGIARIAGTTYRLLASPLTATWNAAERSVDVEVMLEGRAPAFGALDSTNPVSLGMLRLRAAGEIPSITFGLSSADGFFNCEYFERGLGCTFDVQTATGDRIIGSLGADARLI